MGPKHRRAAFTLVELLVVISIILIASSIIFVGGRGGDGAKLSSAQRILSGIAQGARGQAILKGAPTRLIIYSDAASNEAINKQLSFFGIIYWATERDPNTGAVIAQGWKAATQGTNLPSGIFFNPAFSRDSGGNPIPTMTLDYPRRSIGANDDRTNGGGSEEYYFYEFNSNGTMATSRPETKNINFTNSWLALQAGALRPDDSGDLTVQFAADDPSLGDLENLKVGLIFRRVGTTTLVNDPADITAP